MKKFLLLCCIIILAGYTASLVSQETPLAFSSAEKGASEWTRTIPLQKLKLEGRPEVTVKGNFITFFDAKANRAVLAKLSPKADSIQQFWDLKGSQLPYKQLLRKTKYNALLYEQLRPELVKNGDDSPWILASFAQDSSMLLLIEFILPRTVEGKKQYVADPVYFIYTRHYFNGKKDLYLIDLKSLNDKTKNNFTLHAGKPFFAAGENVFLSLTDTTQKKKHINQLSEWLKTTGGNYEVNKSDSIGYNAEDYKNLRLDSIKFDTNRNYLFNANASLVYDYRKNERITINTVMLFHTASLQDVKEKNSQLLLLVNKKNKLDAMIYDRQLEQIFGQIPLILPADCLLNSARFCHANSVSVLSTDKKVLHIVKFE